MPHYKKIHDYIRIARFAHLGLAVFLLIFVVSTYFITPQTRVVNGPGMLISIFSAVIMIIAIIIGIRAVPFLTAKIIKFNEEDDDDRQNNKWDKHMIYLALHLGRVVILNLAAAFSCIILSMQARSGTGISISEVEVQIALFSLILYTIAWKMWFPSKNLFVKEIEQQVTR